MPPGECSVSLVGAHGAESVLLPACQRVHEVCESVQVRHHEALVEPTLAAGGHVDRAVRPRPGSVLADTPTVEQPGGAVIAGARVHLPRRAAHRRRSLLLLSGDVASLLSYPVVIVSPMRMVHRTARVRLLVTP